MGHDTGRGERCGRCSPGAPGTRRERPLDIWHPFIPYEMTAEQIRRSIWQRHVAAGDCVLDEVRANVTDSVGPESGAAATRRFSCSPVYLPGFAQDRNHSAVIERVRASLGAVVFPVGLTDSPCRLRRIARQCWAKGFALAIPVARPRNGSEQHQRREAAAVVGDDAPRGPRAATTHQWADRWPRCSPAVRSLASRPPPGVVEPALRRCRPPAPDSGADSPAAPRWRRAGLVSRCRWRTP